MKRCPSFFACCLTATLWCATLTIDVPAFGQAAPAAPAAPAGGVIQQQSRPLYIETAVVVLLLGGAVFCVCRSTRRL